MNRNHAAAMFTGVLVCIPLLALSYFGSFKASADWFASFYARGLVLPATGLKAAPLLQYAFYTLAAFVSAWVGIEMDSLWRRLAFLLGVTFLTFTLGCVLALNGVLFEPLSGLVALWLAGIIGMAVGGNVNNYRRHIMRGLFVGRLPTEQFEKLVDEDTPSKMTEKREITVLTCRVLNHTELATHLEAPQFEELTTGFQHGVSEFLISRGGYLDDCDPRQVRVFFGFPLVNENHATHAVQVAAQLVTHIEVLARELTQRFGKEVRLGVALSTGAATCGLFGTDHFQSFSAVGDAVDFSSLLCALNVEYGSKILLSARTQTLVKEAAEVRPLEMVSHHGSNHLTEVYELLGAKGSLSDAEAKARDAFWQGVVHYRKGEYAKARDSFKTAKLENREDGPLAYFQARIESSLNGPTPSSGKDQPKHSRKLAAG